MLKTIIILLILHFPTFSNDLDFKLELEKIEIPDFDGLHSFAYAKIEKYIILIGGRKDGIHARQPFNTFPSDLRNNEILIINTEDFKITKREVDFTSEITEQLLSTNMNFTQVDNDLYITGGFGYSTEIQDHTTFPYLIKIDVNKLLNSILSGMDIKNCFKYIKNDLFAVTGGNLTFMNDYFYLVGGHKFNGRYNPMGHSTFQQEYTNQVRRFQIKEILGNLELIEINKITDPINLRRRDYNLVPQVNNNELYFTIFSGVFQLNADLPFLYPVNIYDNKIEAIHEFSQYLSNYHTAHLPIYNSQRNEMFTIFFGGISQYFYNENNELVNDEDVPFVKTISCVKRNNNGEFDEILLPIKMDNYKGASGEFIFNSKIELLKEQVFDYSILKLNESILIGYIVGGINSNSLNPFSTNNSANTNADNSIYQVKLTKTPTLEVKYVKMLKKFDFNINPNPVDEIVKFNINSDENIQNLEYVITNVAGDIIEKNNLHLKNHEITTFKVPKNQELFITLILNNKYYKTHKFIRK